MLPLPSLIHVIERLPTPVVLTDPLGFVVVASPSAEALLGPHPGHPVVHLEQHLAELATPPRTTRRTSIRSDAGNHELVGLMAEGEQLVPPADVATLAGEIAHDFNNLLGVIMNFASLAAADMPSGSQNARDMAEVLSASRRAAEITNRLMSVSGAHTAGSAAPA